MQCVIVHVSKFKKRPDEGLQFQPKHVAVNEMIKLVKPFGAGIIF